MTSDKYLMVSCDRYEYMELVFPSLLGNGLAVQYGHGHCDGLNTLFSIPPSMPDGGRLYDATETLRMPQRAELRWAGSVVECGKVRRAPGLGHESAAASASW